MPIYFGYPNNKGLEVSPLLKSKNINLLRASPHNVHAIAMPLVKQPGYSSYTSFFPAFMKAQNENTTIPLNRLGYTTNFPVNSCIGLQNPSLVIDYNGPIPAKHVDTLGTIGFERIKMNKRENIVRFPIVSIEEVRTIRRTSPNLTTPAPAQTVNLESFESWVLFLRVISNFLSTHMYPAFRDAEHIPEEIDDLIDLITLKRKATTELRKETKRAKTQRDDPYNGDMQVDDAEEGEVIETGEPPLDVQLSRAKPIHSSESKWGSLDEIPNCDGLFFPFIAELCSPDSETVPGLFEQYLFQSLGDTPEKQLERLDRLRRAWGLLSKTPSGDISAHLCKVIRLAIQAQCRVYPIIQDSVYEGCVLLGARFWLGINGTVYRPLTFSKLQSELGGFSTHNRTLVEIAREAGLNEEMIGHCKSMRKLRSKLLAKNLKEEQRDNIRKLAVHLHFKERFLGVNSNSLSRIIDEVTKVEDGEDDDLPMHHSALFSNDQIFVALSSFGFQAPSFSIENCPRIELKGTPPQTLVFRQKPLDVACQDWKHMLETKEIRNNPRNLSRANRDRSLVGNDKTVIWGKLVQMRSDTGGDQDVAFGGVRVTVETEDNLDDW